MPGLFACTPYQAYHTGQLQAIGKRLRRGCEEKGEGGSIVTIAVCLKCVATIMRAREYMTGRNVIIDAADLGVHIL